MMHSLAIVDFRQAHASRMVEAAGIEPVPRFTRKGRRRATLVASARFSAESVAPSSPLESPPVPWSPP